MNPETLEQEARRLREAIYGPMTDESWRKVVDVWLRDIAWLRVTAAKSEA